MAQNADSTSSGETERQVSVPYEVTLSGVPNEDMEQTIRELAALFTRKDEPPATTAGLRRRIDDDLDLILRYMRSEGYYAARMDGRLNAESQPVEVVIEVMPGPAYRITSVELEVEPADARPDKPDAEDLEIEIGERSEARNIVDAETRIPAWFARRGYPFAKVRDRQVIVDHKDRSVSVTYQVDAGDKARFGEVEVEGLDRTHRDVVRNSIRWEQGNQYNPEAVRQTRDELTATELFDSVRVMPVEPVRDGRVAMRIVLNERKPRTIAFGANFSTSLGPGGNASWTHRNLFGRAERLNIRLEASIPEKNAHAQFRRPNIFRGPQDLIVAARFQERRLDAFDSREAGIDVLVERRITSELAISGGVSLERSRIIESGTTERFTLFGLPLALRYDGTNDELNPTEGFRVDTELKPYTGSGLSFARTTVYGRAYWPVLPENRLILAGWGRVGSIFGEERFELPANKRLFSGGGGSIRGFGFQRIGPLDASNDPEGGRSLFEIGVEARFRITGNWGGVVFIEGGNVFESTMPDFGRPLRWGAGIGVRYMTSLGPLRLDIGVPLNRRGGDSPIQVYISVGQAF